MSDGSYCPYCQRYRCVCVGSAENEKGWVTDADLERWQGSVDRGEHLDVEQCRSLLTEVRRLRREVKQARSDGYAARHEAKDLAERLNAYEDHLEKWTI